MNYDHLIDIGMAKDVTGSESVQWGLASLLIGIVMILAGAITRASTRASATRSGASSFGPAADLSLQKHHHRAEHWIVVQGAAEVTLDGATQLVHKTNSIHVSIGSPIVSPIPATSIWS